LRRAANYMGVVYATPPPWGRVGSVDGAARSRTRDR
jgi:hypothetical protein